jgi:hypothetical protein
MKRIIFSFVFVVLGSVLVSAGDLLQISTTIAEMSYDSSLEYLLKTGDDPTITRGCTYNAYFSELQQLKLVAPYSNGAMEIYEIFNNQETKMFGYVINIPFTGKGGIIIYFDKGIPERIVNLIGKPIKYENYTPE